MVNLYKMVLCSKLCFDQYISNIFDNPNTRNSHEDLYDCPHSCSGQCLFARQSFCDKKCLHMRWTVCSNLENNFARQETRSSTIVLMHWIYRNWTAPCTLYPFNNGDCLNLNFWDTIGSVGPDPSKYDCTINGMSIADFNILSSKISFVRSLLSQGIVSIRWAILIRVVSSTLALPTCRLGMMVRLESLRDTGLRTQSPCNVCLTVHEKT